MFQKNIFEQNIPQNKYHSLVLILLRLFINLKYILYFILSYVLCFIDFRSNPEIVIQTEKFLLVYQGWVRTTLALVLKLIYI